jgi:tetratricopeptide (TPR) repeat protein
LPPLIVHALAPVIDYQERPELEQVRAFWRDEGPARLLALVGIGGSGKTALACRFLQELPHSGLDHPAVAKRPDLPAPEALFVWSFYDQPNVDQFLTTLYHYLSGNPAQPGQTSETAFRLRQLLQSTPGRRALVVLDGLETVQEDRRPGGALGVLRDSSLRHLLRRAAGGGDTRFLLTTRFPLPDLAGLEEAGYRQMDADLLDPASARGLLRARGVQGSPDALDAVIRAFGSHALTLDHLGALLRDFLDGRPERAGELPSPEMAGSGASSDFQAYRLARVFTFYEQHLPPDELRLLQALSVFRLPVDADVLAETFSHRHDRSGQPPLRASKEQLRELLRRLCVRRLVTLSEQPPKTWCSVHPSIRDHFYQTVGQAVSSLHDQVRRHLVSLVERPGQHRLPTDGATLDLIEELIHHTVRLGDHGQAARCYFGQMGGYEHLGWHLGEYQRGLRITTALLGDGSSEWAFAEEVIQDQALFLAELGYPEQAEGIMRSVTPAEGWEMWEGLFYPTTVQNLCEVLVLRGQLREAEGVAAGLVKEPPEADTGAGEGDSYRAYRRAFPVRSHYFRIEYSSCPAARLALVRGLQGKVQEALAEYERLDQVCARVRADDRSPHGYRVLGNPIHLYALSQAALLTRLGRLARARAILVRWQRAVSGDQYPILRMAGELALADVLRFQGEYSDTLGCIERPLAWALKTGHQEIHCRANLALGRLRLAQGEHSEAEQAVEEARSIAVECDFRLLEIDCLTSAGRIALARGDLDAALQAGREGEAMAGDPECGYAWGEGSALHLQGEARARRGEPAEATPLLERALAIRRRIGDPREGNTRRLLQEVAGGG